MSVQARLADGARLVARMKLSHRRPRAPLRGCVRTSPPPPAPARMLPRSRGAAHARRGERAYMLGPPIPPRPLNELARTVEQARLKDALVIQC
jgi:hypothetical protein